MKTLFAALAMLCLVGCIAYDDDSGLYKAPRRLKYITKAVNSIESRASQGISGKGEITPWTLTFETDASLVDMTRYTVQNKSLANYKQMFKRFVHGGLSYSAVPVGNEAEAAN